MKVAYILNSFPNISETFILDEITSLLREGVDCHVLSLARPAEQPTHPEAQALLDAGRVTYLPALTRRRKALLLTGRFLRRPLRTLATWSRHAGDGQSRWLMTSSLAAARAAELLRADRVHAHYASPAGQCALGVKRWTGLPCTITTHHWDIFLSPPDNYRELACATDGVICISQYNRRYIAETFGAPLDKLPLVRCGVYTDAFEPAAPAALAGRPPRLLCVARLEPVKGHRYLLEALALLHADGLPASLVLVGEGSQRRPLESLCAALGLTEFITFAGFHTKEQVARLYRDCDMVVLPSLSEGIPMVLMEAMASARPVVATAVRGVPELVEDALTGRLCNPEDSPGLARAIRWVVDHPEEAGRMAERGRQRVLAEFDRSVNTRRLLTVWGQTTSAA